MPATMADEEVGTQPVERGVPAVAALPSVVGSEAEHLIPQHELVRVMEEECARHRAQQLRQREDFVMAESLGRVLESYGVRIQDPQCPSDVFLVQLKLLRGLLSDSPGRCPPPFLGLVQINGHFSILRHRARPTLGPFLDVHLRPQRLLARFFVDVVVALGRSLVSVLPTAPLEVADDETTPPSVIELPAGAKVTRTHL